MTRSHLFCFGFGYSALVLARRLAASGWVVTGTCRSAEKAALLREAGFSAVPFDHNRAVDAITLSEVTHLLVSVPPDATGDPVLDRHGDGIAAMSGLSWLGYLSTTGVYGDRGGGWVDETARLLPTGERGRRRVAAEKGWLDLWRNRSVPVHIFRLAGGLRAFHALRRRFQSAASRFRQRVGASWWLCHCERDCAIHQFLQFAHRRELHAGHGHVHRRLLLD